MRIVIKAHAYPQIMIKTPAKFQKDQPKTVGGVVLTRFLPLLYFHSVEAQKMSKLKI